MVNEYKISCGRDRTEVTLQAQYIGEDTVIFIYNENAHIGSVSVVEYDPKSKRSSTSVITRLGHRDDTVARQAAYRISKVFKKPVCVVAGIHVEDINQQEIEEILENVQSLVEKFIQSQ